MVIVAAENGFYLRKGGKNKPWLRLWDNLDLDWMSEVRSVFQYFTERTPKSFIEERDTYLSWSYRDCDLEFGESQAHSLITHLTCGSLANAGTHVLNHSRIVQVRPAGISKGLVTERVVAELGTLLARRAPRST